MVFSRTLGFNAPSKGPFSYSWRFSNSSVKRESFTYSKYCSHALAGTHSTHSPGFIIADAPPALFEKKINKEESTELDKVYFPFCLLVQYEKLSTNSLEPLDFWTQESKEKFNRMADKHACHRQKRLFRPSVRHTAPGGGPGGPSLRRRLRLAQKWSGAYSCYNMTNFLQQ